MNLAIISKALKYRTHNSLTLCRERNSSASKYQIAYEGNPIDATHKVTCRPSTTGIL